MVLLDFLFVFIELFLHHRMESQRRLQLQFDQVRSRSMRRFFLSIKISIFYLVKKLQQLHEKHIRRPDFDENSSEEKEIESITKDITAVYI